MYSFKTALDAAPQMADTLAYLEERLQRSNAALETALESAPDTYSYSAADEESMEDVQKLLALVIRLFVSNSHAGREMPFFGPGHGVCATDVMIASTEMLKVVNVQLFELGMFQTWSKH